MDLAPHEIDQRISRAADDLRRADRALRQDPHADRSNVLERHRAVSTQSMWIELGERSAKDAILGAARSWVYALTLARVVWPARLGVAKAWHAPSIEVPDLEHTRLSPRTVVDRLLLEPVSDRRRFYADAFVGGATSLRDAEFVAAERRAQVIRRLGIDDVDAFEVPLDPASALPRLAERVLEVTRDFVPRGLQRWDDVMSYALARDAADGWPAKLSLRWFSELFAGTGLLDGLSLGSFDLPRLLGATSFVRALALFGRVYAEVDVTRSAPFVFVRSPFDLRVARRAALFGMLPADPLFGMRLLGLGRSRAQEQAREIAKALVCTLRLDAARVLLRGVVLASPKARRERFEELTDHAAGIYFPGELAFVLPQLSANDPTRLLGTLLAVADRHSLIERFDEDWFRSPHAMFAIRAEQAEVPVTKAPKDAVVDARTSPLLFRTSDQEIEAAVVQLQRLLVQVFG